MRSIKSVRIGRAQRDTTGFAPKGVSSDNRYGRAFDNIRNRIQSESLSPSLSARDRVALVVHLSANDGAGQRSLESTRFKHVLTGPHGPVVFPACSIQLCNATADGWWM